MAEIGFIEGDYIRHTKEGINTNYGQKLVGKASLFNKTDVYFWGHPTPKVDFIKWTPIKGEWVLCWDNNYSEPLLKRANDNVLNDFYDHVIPYLGQDMNEFDFLDTKEG